MTNQLDCTALTYEIIDPLYGHRYRGSTIKFIALYNRNSWAKGLFRLKIGFAGNRIAAWWSLQLNQPITQTGDAQHLRI